MHRGAKVLGGIPVNNGSSVSAIKSKETPNNKQLGYFFFRILMGAMFFLHGFMRVLTGLVDWEARISLLFADAILPMGLVHLIMFVIPIAEIIIGLSLLLGLKMRWGICGAFVLMLVLLTGHGIRQNWPGTHLVVPYGLYFGILLIYENYNWLALDNLRRGNIE